MKKLVTIAMAALLVFTMGTTAFAGTITDPGVEPGTSDNTIDTYGYIGPEAKIDPGDPGDPPIVTTIDVSIPTKMLWAAFEGSFASGSAPIDSANHLVMCNTGSVDVDVTVQSFTAKATSPTLPASSTLTLDLNIADHNASGATVHSATISNLIGTSATHIATLTAGHTINMTFTGAYADTAAFPTTAIQPTYDMVLKVAAV